MGRILAIDYGKKRVGIAVTDPMQIIAQPLVTIDTPKILDFFCSVFSANAELETNNANDKKQSSFFIQPPCCSILIILIRGIILD